MSIFVDNWVRKYCRSKWKVDPATVLPDGTIEPATIYGLIGYKEVYELMPKEILNPNNNTVYKTRPDMMDTEYRLTSVDEIKRFLAWDRTNNEKIYDKEYYDCDDFAVVLWGRAKTWSSGLCLGMMRTVSPSHAKNFFIDAKKVVYELEPQSDTIKPIYSLVTAYIL